MTDLDLSAFELASIADCASPDSRESAGAIWLRQIQDYFNENFGSNVEYPEDFAAQAADYMVPVYTHELWSIFVDLAAYREDVSELGFVVFDSTNPDRLPMTALYMIAERLVNALIEEL